MCLNQLVMSSFFLLKAAGGQGFEPCATWMVKKGAAAFEVQGTTLIDRAGSLEITIGDW